METKEERETYWQGHVLAWVKSGQTQRAYCTEHGLKPHSLSYWQLRLRAKERAQEVEGRARPPLTLVRAIAPTSPPAPTSLVSLHSPTGWRLEFTTLPPATWLSELWRGQA
jgi:hypothetical protein